MGLVCTFHLIGLSEEPEPRRGFCEPRVDIHLRLLLRGVLLQDRRRLQTREDDLHRPVVVVVARVFVDPPQVSDTALVLVVREVLLELRGFVLAHICKGERVRAGREGAGIAQGAYSCELRTPQRGEGS